MEIFLNAIKQAVSIKQDAHNEAEKIRNEAEKRIDENLLQCTFNAMKISLANSRDAGKFGWWDENTCSVEHLSKLRERAFQDGDDMAILNYTAMIMARIAAKTQE